MAEFIFPEKRFLEAGVPRPIVEKMRLEFTRSDATIRRALCEFWSTKSAGGLRDYVFNASYSETTISEPVIETPVVDTASESTQRPPDDDESVASEEVEQSDTTEDVDAPSDESDDEV